MLRAALATAGAHEAPAGRTAQAVLHQELAALVVPGQHKRFCIRNLLHSWFGLRATEDFIWEVCQLAATDDEEEVCGWDILPPPRRYPRRHRELLRAIVAVRLGIGKRQVCLHELDAAYSVAFPGSTAINVSKKKLEN